MSIAIDLSRAFDLSLCVRSPVGNQKDTMQWGSAPALCPITTARGDQVLGDTHGSAILCILHVDMCLLDHIHMSWPFLIAYLAVVVPKDPLKVLDTRERLK